MCLEFSLQIFRISLYYVEEHLYQFSGQNTNVLEFYVNFCQKKLFLRKKFFKILGFQNSADVSNIFSNIFLKYFLKAFLISFQKIYTLLGVFFSFKDLFPF